MKIRILKVWRRLRVIQIGLKYHSGTFKRDTLGVRVREEDVVKTETLIRVMLLKMGKQPTQKKAEDTGI